MVKRSFSDAFVSFTKFFKAIPTDDLNDLVEFTDQWNEVDGEHRVPSRSVLRTGPAEEASGAGAVRMSEHYVTDAKRGDGNVEAYGELHRMLCDLEPALKAAGLSIVKSPNGTNGSSIGKAEKLLARATRALRKAELDGDDDARRTHLESTLKSLSAAKVELQKAEDEEEDREDNDPDDDAEEERVEKARITASNLENRLQMLVKSVVAKNGGLPTTNPSEMFAALRGNGPVMPPPSFVKAVQQSTEDADADDTDSLQEHISKQIARSRLQNAHHIPDMVRKSIVDQAVAKLKD